MDYYYELTMIFIVVILVHCMSIVDSLILRLCFLLIKLHEEYRKFLEKYENRGANLFECGDGNQLGLASLMC